MRVKRNCEDLAMLLTLSGLVALVGCGQAASSMPTAETSDEQATITSKPDVLNANATDPAVAACCEVPKAADEAADVTEVTVQNIAGGVVLPDVTLLNQDGEPVRFHEELVRDKIVAINFVFTTCKGICPPMGANFAALQRRLGDRYDGDVALVSVSVDPTTDTPQRLKAWREKFGGGPGWTLLTGEKRDVDHLLKELEVFTADKNDHSPFILIGDEAAGKWSRVHGLTSPEKLAEIIADLHAAAQAADPPSTSSETATADGTDDTRQANPVNAVPEPPATEQADAKAEQVAQQMPPAQKYFTEVELVNQHGEHMRLYSDVLKGKVVVINSFFSTCKGSCPVMMSSFARIQERFADRLGKDLVMISITVDPTTDTPELLASYAKQWQAKPGWYFLTGEKANVDTASYKLGSYVENKESHSNIFIIGNEATGLWKKVKGLSKPEELFPLIEEVLNDKI
ncbi:MAG: SCO family protein [Planctomycetota bacterium]